MKQHPHPQQRTALLRVKLKIKCARFEYTYHYWTIYLKMVKTIHFDSTYMLSYVGSCWIAQGAEFSALWWPRWIGWEIHEGGDICIHIAASGFLGSSAGKESACSAGDLCLMLGLGRSSGGGHGSPLQYSCLENPHRQRSLGGYSPWGCKESDTTEQASTAHSWFIPLYSRNCTNTKLQSNYTPVKIWEK